MTSRNRAVAIATALVLVIALAASAVIWFRSSQSAVAVPQDRLGPVLLVPGRAADSGSLVDLQRRLYLSGRRALIVSTGGDDNGDLRAQAAQVQETAQQLIADGAPSVDVVGFSGGGVVTRIWLANGGAEVVRRVVTIGTPNQGATGKQLDELVTERFCDVTCPQLTAGSTLLNELPDAGGPAPWVNLWTTQDRVVSAPSANLPGAKNISLQSICPKQRPTHDELPADPLVIGIVLRTLTPNPVFTSLTKDDCEILLQEGSAPIDPGQENILS